MSLNGTQMLTAIGQQKLAAAAMGGGSQVAITQVALGDGNGAKYAPFEAQTALKRERVRNPITRQHMSDDRTWRVTVEFGTDIPAFWMREIGFFDAEGDLIVIVAGSNIQEGYTSAFDLLFEGFLDLSGVKDGIVIVEAPDDELFCFAVVTATEVASNALQTLRLADELRAIQHKEALT